MKGLFFLLLIFLLLSFGCQHSNPVDNPPDKGEPPKGYNLYVGNWGGNEVFVMDTDSNAVVDTLSGFPYTIWHLAVTKSGRKLYVCTRNDVPPTYSGNVFSVDLKARNSFLISNEISDVFVAPNGLVFVITYMIDSKKGALGVIDTVMDAITYVDTLDIRDAHHNYQAVAFDRNRPLLYAVNNSNHLFAYDYDKKEIVRTYQSISLLRQMVISNDGRYLYFAGGPVFDLETGQAIANVGGNALGSLALSPDGEYLYITDPGVPGNIEITPSGKVFIFQTSTNSYVGEIDVKEIEPNYGWLTDRIDLMPDGKTAYVSGWHVLVYVMDLENREVTNVIEIPGFTRPMILGVKP